MSRRLAPALALAVAGCGGSDPADPVDATRPADAARPIDAATVDAAPCPTLETCGWLEPYQREIVGRLAGERELVPGVTLASRASRADRDAVRAFLIAELARLGYTPAEQAYAASGANVIATLAATGGAPDAGLIVLGAHFDGVPAVPAAADNATGVAVVLAAARWLPTITDRRHPIAFVLFDEEEVGLVGSGAYAEQLEVDATPVAAVHNFDMISWDADGDRAVELWSPAQAIEDDYRLVASPAGIAIQPVEFTFSDHQQFVIRGFPTVGVSEEYVAGDHTPHYHEATDTYDKIDFTYLGGVTRLALEVIAGELAAE